MLRAREALVQPRRPHVEARRRARLRGKGFVQVRAKPVRMVERAEPEPSVEATDVAEDEAAAPPETVEEPAAADAPHEAVEGPEESLEGVRDEAHGEAGELARLRARVDELEAMVGEAAAREKELKDRLARALADFDNFRRRARDESTAATARGKEALLKALLPALDNLDRALAHSEDEGLRMIARSLASTLAEQGVVIVAPEGDAFDAKLHEAIAQESREDAKSGTVVTVVEKGYVLDGRVVRPARVVVAA